MNFLSQNLHKEYFTFVCCSRSCFRTLLRVVNTFWQCEHGKSLSIALSMTLFDAEREKFG
jgi:hypothetical protein